MENRSLKTPVHVVKQQISETLNDVSQKLESFFEDQDNSKLIEESQALLSQVSGSLQLMSLVGATTLAKEMHDLCGAIKEKKVSNLSGTLELLVASTMFIPRYLEYIGQSQQEHPVLALNTINALRKEHRQSLIPEHIFLDFKHSGPSPSETNKEDPVNQDLIQQAKRLRHMYQVGLLGVINGNAVTTHLKYMDRALERFENLSGTLPCQEIWRIGQAIIEALQEGGIQLDLSVKHILGVIDREIRANISNSASFSDQVSDELRQSLLYYVAKSCIDSTRVKQIKDQYDLFNIVEDEAFILEQRDKLEAPDRSVIQRVAEEIVFSIEQVKEQLDQLDRMGTIDATQGEASIETLEKISVTLMMLDLLHASETTSTIKEQLSRIISLPNRPTPEQIAELADKLVSVEIAVFEFSQGINRTDDKSLPVDANYAEAIQLTIKEARTNLDQVKDSLETFIQNYMEISSISEIPELLKEVKGALSILEFDLVAQIVDSCQRYIYDQIISPQKHPKDSEIEILADTLASIEWYLECYEHYHENDEALLEVACESIEELGYKINQND